MNPKFVRYDSDKVVIKIYYEDFSEQVGFVIARLGDPSGVEYGLGHLMALTDEDSGWRYRDPVAESPNELGRAVSTIASGLRTYGSTALSGEPVVFSRLFGVGMRFINRRSKEQTDRSRRRHVE